MRGQREIMERLCEIMPGLCGIIEKLCGIMERRDEGTFLTKL